MADEPTHRYVGDHPINLPSGAMIGRGDRVTLTEDDLKDPYIKELLASDAFLTLKAKLGGDK